MLLYLEINILLKNSEVPTKCILENILVKKCMFGKLKTNIKITSKHTQKNSNISNKKKHI